MNILLTGASRGIGAATRSIDLIRPPGRGPFDVRGGDGLIAGDLADPQSPRKIWNEALTQLDGRIDVLVNNAGIYEASALGASDDEWHAAWDRTMHQPASVCRPLPAGREAFPDHGGGRIVNVASRAAYRGDSPSHWHYAASKSALIGMTKTIARGYAAENILAFAVAPGFTVSEMTEEYLAGRGGGDCCRHSARPGDQHDRSRRGDPLAGDRRARRLDRLGHRSQRSQLCSLASSPPLQRPNRRSSPFRSARSPAADRAAHSSD